MKISFVILHYLTINDTIECVNSIEHINYHDIEIIIVDNGSPNETGSQIDELYSKNEKIHVILNKKNIGFAKGNNIGFQFAKYQLDTDFVILINNDTIIKQVDFCKELIDIYKKSNFDICGPNIISLVDQEKQNPVPVIFKNVYQVKKRIIKLQVLLFLNTYNLDKIVSETSKKIYKFKRKKENSSLENCDDFQLHGSCLIFSKKYIEQYDGLHDSTFMYFEEDILKFISVRDNLNMVYSDSLTIYHKEDSATNEFFKKEKTKRRFYYTNSIQSCKQLIMLYKG